MHFHCYFLIVSCKLYRKQCPKNYDLCNMHCNIVKIWIYIVKRKQIIKWCFRPEESSDMGLVYPCYDTAFKLLLSARFCSAVWCHITDCDETYNYWEPVSL